MTSLLFIIRPCQRPVALVSGSRCVLSLQDGPGTQPRAEAINTCNEGKGKGLPWKDWGWRSSPGGISPVAKGQHSLPLFLEPGCDQAGEFPFRFMWLVLPWSSASVPVPHSEDSYYCPLSPPNFLSQEFEQQGPLSSERQRRRP